jgi:hypothetical protein
MAGETPLLPIKKASARECDRSRTHTRTLTQLHSPESRDLIASVIFTIRTHALRDQRQRRGPI